MSECDSYDTGLAWSIRTKLQIERHSRDLAMLNLAIDSAARLFGTHSPRGTKETLIYRRAT
jgi:hypothetical protein